MSGPAVYVCTDPGVPVFGRKGASVHVQQVLRELVRRHPRVHLVTCRPGGPAPAGLEGVVVHALPRPLGRPEERERLARELDPEVVAVLARVAAAEGAPALVYQRYGLWSCAPMELARDRGWPGVLEVNAPLPEEQARHRVLVDLVGAVHLTRRAMASARLVHAVSEPVARWAERTCPAAGPVPVVPNGVDVAAFRPSATARGRRVLAFTGTFRPWHGVDLLVEAAARLRCDPQDPGTRLLLVGDGPSLPEALRRAQDLGVPVRATGAVDPAAVPRLLDGADVGVAPYPAGEHYFSPLKVGEYLAAGLPTVAADVAGLGRQVEHGREALLVPPGDLGALVSALRRVRDDAPLRGRLAAAGRAAARSRLSWGSYVDAVLLRLAERAPTRPRAAAAAPGAW